MCISAEDCPSVVASYRTKVYESFDRLNSNLLCKFRRVVFNFLSDGRLVRKHVSKVTG